VIQLDAPGFALSSLSQIHSGKQWKPATTPASANAGALLAPATTQRAESEEYARRAPKFADVPGGFAYEAPEKPALFCSISGDVEHDPSQAQLDYALIVAAEAGRPDEIRILLEAGADATRSNSISWKSALTLAVEIRNLDCVRLLAPVSDVDATDFEEMTALMRAAGSGQPRVVETLLPFAKLTQANVRGETALYMAAQDGHAECARLLANPETCAQRTRQGESAFEIAVQWGHLDAVRTLMPFTDLNACNFLTQTPLMQAVGMGDSDLVALLAPHSDLSVRTNSGQTAFELGYEHKNWLALNALGPYLSDHEVLRAASLARAHKQGHLLPALAAREETLELTAEIQAARQAQIGEDGAQASLADPLPPSNSGPNVRMKPRAL